MLYLKIARCSNSNYYLNVCLFLENWFYAFLVHIHKDVLNQYTQLKIIQIDETQNNTPQHNILSHFHKFITVTHEKFDCIKLTLSHKDLRMVFYAILNKFSKLQID